LNKRIITTACNMVTNVMQFSILQFAINIQCGRIKIAILAS